VITITQRLIEARPADVQLVLPYDLRKKSRLRTTLDDGEIVGVILERGQVLRGGDRLLADDGRIVEIVAAEEEVSTVTSTNARELARVSYHLGNRHVSLQIGADWLRYQHDHVLDDMVRRLGLSVRVELAAFEPEGGAYGVPHGHDHHGHAHDQSGAEHEHGGIRFSLLRRHD
jgi:urease accessory protein